MDIEPLRKRKTSGEIYTRRPLITEFIKKSLQWPFEDLLERAPIRRFGAPRLEWPKSQEKLRQSHQEAADLSSSGPLIFVEPKTDCAHFKTPPTLAAFLAREPSNVELTTTIDRETKEMCVLNDRLGCHALSPTRARPQARSRWCARRAMRKTGPSVSTLPISNWFQPPIPQVYQTDSLVPIDTRALEEYAPAQRSRSLRR